MLADQVDHVVGVDPHRDEHVLAVVVAPSGAGQSRTQLASYLLIARGRTGLDVVAPSTCLGLDELGI